MMPVRKVISLVLLLAGMGFIGVLLARGWGDISALLAATDWPLFAASALVSIGGIVATSAFFRYLLLKHGMLLPRKLVHRIFFYGQIAKYVPGKVWGILYQAASVDRKGAGFSITAANIDLMAISIVANTGIALTLIVLGFDLTLGVIAFFAGMGMTILASSSRAVGSVLRWAHARLGGGGVAQEDADSDAPTAVFPVVSYYTLVSVTGVLAYYLMMSAVFSFSFDEAMTYVAYLILSWVVGVFAFLAPAGVGIRELVFIAFGTYTLPDVSIDLLAAIALVARFWQVLQELLLAAAVLTWNTVTGNGR